MRRQVGQVRFENGLTMTIESSFCANIGEREKLSFEILGDKGGGQYGPLQMHTEEERTLLDITPVHIPEIVHPHHEQIKSFVNSVINDTPVFTPGEEALQVTRIIDAIYASSEAGREIRLD